MKSFLKVKFKEVVEELGEFCNQIQSKYDLIPQRLISSCINNGFKMQKNVIANWDLYEKGVAKISSEEIIYQLFYNLNVNSEDDILVVLDSSFVSDECFIVKYSLINEFVDYHNNNFENSDFFGPFDHLFFIKSLGILVILHHEGVVFTIKGKIEDGNLL